MKFPTPEEIVRGMMAAEKAVQKLAAQGWTIPSHMTPAEAYEISDQDPDGYDAFFFGFFTDQGGEEFAHLASDLRDSSILQRWKPLVEQCLAAYDQQLFLVTIPCLFPIIEGVVSSLGGTGKAAARCKALAAAGSYDDLAKVVWSSVATFVDKAFEDGRTTSTVTLNRNLILHGKSDPGQWTQVDSVRLFNALHTLAFVAKWRPTGSLRSI
jgi:hypothetical protein